MFNTNTTTNTAVFSASSILMKKAIPSRAYIPIPKPRSSLILTLSSRNKTNSTGYQMRFSGDLSPEFPGNIPPEFPTRKPDYQRTTVPKEVPEIPKTPDVDQPCRPEVESPPPGQWPDIDPDFPTPFPPSTPPDDPPPPPNLPPPPDRLPPNPSPDVIPPPSTPPNVESAPSAIPETPQPCCSY